MPNAANLNRSPTTESARSHPAIAVARTVQDWETVSFNRPASGKAPGGGGPGPRKPGSAATSSGIAAAKLEGETEELKRERLISNTA